MATRRTWVVGIDGSADSRTALAWAAAQATGRDVEIVALCTWRAPVLPSDAIGQPALLMDWGGFETALRRTVDQIIASVTSGAGSDAGSDVVSDVVSDEPETGPANVPRIVSRIEQGRAASVLIEASREAELLVVGSRGRGGLGGVVLGSVSRQCATHASVPVAVVPDDVVFAPIRHFVVGFDGSRNARAAVVWALRFASADSTIDVVRSVELAPWLDEAHVRERFPAEVEKASVAFESDLAELDPDRRTRRSFKLQDARQALAEAAEGADVVVLGACGRGRFSAVLLGSVSTWMLHGASHATVIVPDPQK